MIFDKKELRKKVSTLKGEFSRDELKTLSDKVIVNLSNTDIFKKADTILLYYSMPDEVNTEILIHLMNDKKNILLPIVDKTGLILKKYTSNNDLQISSYGIKEPTGDAFTDYDDIDLVVVPGVAFDRAFNRMGRGKGYYDRLLPKIKAPKLAICFDFQLFDNIPFDDNDVKMDIIVCESEIIE